jgi:PAS domain S-box-containing protein
MKKPLEKKIIFFAFILLFLTILANSGMDIVGFRRDYVNALVLRSHSLGITMKNSVEKVLGLGLDLMDIAGLSEKCQELVQGNPEVAYCVITDLDGVPIFYSDPSFRSLKFDQINSSFSTKQGQRVNLIGNKTVYYDAVIPIMSLDGKLVAKIHVGFREKVVTEKVETMIISSVIVLMVSFLLAFSLVIYFVKKNIMQPITTLQHGLDKISRGAFDTRIEEVPDDEFNELAKHINDMSESLKNREEEIQKNYLELENTHIKLHSSYLKLEGLSNELEKSEELYKSLLEDASDAIVVMDNMEEVRIVNKLAEDFFGFTSSEITGLPLKDLLHLLNIENIPRVGNLFKDAAGGEHIDEEIQFVKKNGTRVVSRLHASSIKSGNEQLVQAIFRDVTKEREILNNLEKSAEDLARLNKMKDSFLGLASHELKTPLTVILGYSELMIAEMAGKLDKSEMEMLEYISSAANRLDIIVKDMVDVSLIDEKRLKLVPREINLNRLLELSINELRIFFLSRKQDLSLQLDDSIPNIKGDSPRLIQLFSNVLVNAMKFTPDGGRIRVTTCKGISPHERINPLSEESPDELKSGSGAPSYIEVSIEDSGIGIDHDEQQRIFDKFYEVGNISEHSSGKFSFKAKGTGLGLAIAKGIVEMHGGRIWVESPGFDPERCPGSTFHILLPIEPHACDVAVDYLNIV